MWKILSTNGTMDKYIRLIYLIVYFGTFITDLKVIHTSDNSVF